MSGLKTLRVQRAFSERQGTEDRDREEKEEEQEEEQEEQVEQEEDREEDREGGWGRRGRRWRWWQRHLARRKYMGRAAREVAAVRRAVWVAVMWR